MPSHSSFKINAYSPACSAPGPTPRRTLGRRKVPDLTELAPRGPPPHVPARRCNAPSPRAPALPSTAGTRIALAASPTPDLPNSSSALGRSILLGTGPRSAPAHSEHRPRGTARSPLQWLSRLDCVSQKPPDPYQLRPLGPFPVSEQLWSLCGE